MGGGSGEGGMGVERGIRMQSTGRQWDAHCYQLSQEITQICFSPTSVHEILYSGVSLLPPVVIVYTGVSYNNIAYENGV